MCVFTRRQTKSIQKTYTVHESEYGTTLCSTSNVGVGYLDNGSGTTASSLVILRPAAVSCPFISMRAAGASCSQAQRVEKKGFISQRSVGFTKCLGLKSWKSGHRCLKWTIPFRFGHSAMLRIQMFFLKSCNFWQHRSTTVCACRQRNWQDSRSCHNLHFSSDCC